MLNFEIKPDVTASTCPAKIWRAGSAMEIKKPSINPAKITADILFVFAIAEPIVLPIGVSPISTPNKNIVNPIIIRTAPIRNLISIGVSIGVKVK